MEKLILVFFVQWLFLCPLISQVTISGKVEDSKGAVIPIGNVIIISKEDSTFISGDVFYDGVLEISINDPVNKMLKIESLGFEAYMLDIPQESTQLGVIVMNSASFALETVTVSSKKSQLFSQSNGTTTVNVENTALSSMGTVVDILMSSPGILVNGSDEVSMFGKGAVKIFIDGEEVSTPDILKSMTSEQIKSIEIIRNPSAKYDASGKGGVINIVTKNAGLEGLLGQLILNTTKATYQRAYIGGNISYKKGSFSVYSSLDWNPYKVFSNENYYRVIETENYVSILNNKIDEDKISLVNNGYSLKIGYQLSEHNKLSAEVKGHTRSNDNDRYNTNEIEVNGIPSNTLNSISDMHRTLNYQIYNLAYTFQDSLGRFLKLSGSATTFEFTNEDLVDETYLVSGELLNRKNLGDNHIDIFLGKMDYEQPILNEFAKLELGAKYSTSDNKSETDYFTLEANQWVEKPQYMNGFNYSEANTAAYINFTKEVKKLNFRGGLRFEQNHTVASSINSGSFLDTVYHNFFPSLGVEYKFNDDIALDISYSNRIKRPSFQDLDPYVIYLDSFSLLRGTPDLQPEIVRGVEANLSYSGSPLFTIGYSETKNPIYVMVESAEMNPLVSIGVSRNLNYENIFNLQIVAPYQNDWWTSANGFGYNRKELQFANFNEGAPFVKKDYFVFSYQDFNFKGWNMGAQFFWFSPGVEGIFEYSSGYELNAWFGKKFLDGKFRVRLLLNDILKSTITTSKSQIGNLFITQKGYYDSRRARIIFTYKFGKLKVNQKGKEDSSSEFNRIKMD